MLMILFIPKMKSASSQILGWVNLTLNKANSIEFIYKKFLFWIEIIHPYCLWTCLDLILNKIFKVIFVDKSNLKEDLKLISWKGLKA